MFSHQKLHYRCCCCVPLVSPRRCVLVGEAASMPHHGQQNPCPRNTEPVARGFSGSPQLATCRKSFSLDVRCAGDGERWSGINPMWWGKYCSACLHPLICSEERRKRRVGVIMNIIIVSSNNNNRTITLASRLSV